MQIQIPYLFQSKPVQHNPNGAILRITDGARSRKTYNAERSICKWFETVQNLSAEPRPYHSEREERGRQTTEATTVKGKKESRHTWF